MALPPSPPGVNLSESRVPLILGANISTFILAAIAVCLRFLSRRLTRARIWWDDGLITLALALAVPMLLVNIIWNVQHGFGKHIWVAPSDAFEVWAKALFVSEFTYTLGVTCVKFSLLCFYWRIFKRSTIRIPIYTIGGIVICWAIALLLVIVLQCVPLSLVWGEASTPRDMVAGCKVNIQEFFIGNAYPNIITDVAIIILPMPYVWKLHLRRAQKTALTYVFILGVFVVGVSIARLNYVIRLDLTDPDITWNFTSTQIWTSVECNIGIVCACLPSLQPLLNLILVGSVDRTKKSAARRSDVPTWPSHFNRNASQPSENTIVGQEDRSFGERKFTDDALLPRTVISSPVRIESFRLGKGLDERLELGGHVHVRTDIEVMNQSVEDDSS